MKTIAKPRNGEKGMEFIIPSAFFATSRSGFVFGFIYRASRRTCAENGMLGYSGKSAGATRGAVFRDGARDIRVASTENGKEERISRPFVALPVEAIDRLVFGFPPDT
jgi:hypothetical protein